MSTVSRTEPLQGQVAAKTYKREVAVALLVYLLVFFLWGVFEPRADEIARFLTLPIFTFAAGAFGLDALAKQLR